jgi:hypothetical protein
MAIAYGNPGAMVARFPDREKWRSPRIVQCRAAQAAIVPESQVRMASSEADSSRSPTWWGFSKAFICLRHRVIFDW